MLRFGRAAGRLFAIVGTAQGERWRIISARKANATEGKRYGDG